MPSAWAARNGAAQAFKHRLRVPQGGPGNGMSRPGWRRRMPCRGRFPIVGEYGRAAREQCLLAVVGCHGLAAGGKVRLDAPERRLVQLQRQSEVRGDRPAGQVVTGGTQPAGQDDQIGWRAPVTRERFGQCHAQPFRTVPDHALAVYGNAKLSQTAGRDQRHRCSQYPPVTARFPHTGSRLCGSSPDACLRTLRIPPYRISNRYYSTSPKREIL